jgi:MSHA biogenesis protein MshJ
MKRYWETLSSRINALTLRERAIIFAMCAVAVLGLFNLAVLKPQLVRQKKAEQKIKDDQARIGQIQTLLQAENRDPDAANRERLKVLKGQLAQMQARMNEMQHTLVPPEKMTELLETILRRNGRLKLVALKTLPVSSLNESNDANVKDKALAIGGAAQGTTAQSSDIYKHGFEITVRGNYLDMVDYIQALEKMPWRLYWARAELEVVGYPDSDLTLRLYTLSLDRKWLNI